MGGGGVANAAGTTAIAAGGSGGIAKAAAGTLASDTTKCPAWPASKVLPMVDPLFYGRDAGPCTSRLVDANGSVTTTTYTYASGQLQSMTHGAEFTSTMTWTAGLLTDRCQLVQRIAMNGGLADPRNTITYEYDALGHVSARRFGDGCVETFEYSCWKN